MFGLGNRLGLGGSGAPPSSGGGAGPALLILDCEGDSNNATLSLFPGGPDGIGALAASQAIESYLPPLYLGAAAPGKVYFHSESGTADVRGATYSASSLTIVDTPFSFSPFGASAITLAATAAGVGYAFCLDNDGDYAVAALNFSGGAVVRIGNQLEDNIGGAAGFPVASSVIDGRFCIVHRPGGKPSGIELRAFAFDGTDWTAQQTLSPLPDYSTIRACGAYIAGFRNDGATIDIYRYTVAGGFELAATVDSTTLVPDFAPPSPDIFLDRVTTRAWVPLADVGNTEFRIAVLNVNAGAGTVTLQSTLDATNSPYSYGQPYADYSVSNNESFAGLNLHRRNGSTFTLLPGFIDSVGTNTIILPAA